MGRRKFSLRQLDVFEKVDVPNTLGHPARSLFVLHNFNLDVTE